MSDLEIETESRPTADGRRVVNRYLWIAAGLVLVLGLMAFVDRRTGRLSGALLAIDRPDVEEVLMPPFGIKHAYCTYRIRLHGRLYGSSIAGQWIMESEDGSRTTFQHAWQRIGGRRDVDYPAHLEFFALLLNNESESLGEISPLAASGSLKHLIPGGTRFWNGHEVPVVEFINPETNQKTRLILVVKR